MKLTLNSRHVNAGDIIPNSFCTRTKKEGFFSHIRIGPIFGYFSLVWIINFFLCTTTYHEYEYRLEHRLIYIGIYVAFVLFLSYVFIYEESGVLVRALPTVWQCIYIGSLMYLFIILLVATLPKVIGRRLVYLLVEKKRYTFLKSKSSFHSELDNAFTGTTDLRCVPSLKTLEIQMKKMWFYSHIIGWFAKMCIFRDWIFCSVLSVAFEVVELSFQEYIPELKECWWDSIFLDVIVTNTLGMSIGYALLRYLKCKRYCWFYPFSTTSCPICKTRSKECSVAQWKLGGVHFPCLSYALGNPCLHWGFVRSITNFYHMVFLFLTALTTELMAFFIMYILKIPAWHIFHKIRITMFCLLALNGVAEVYSLYVDSVPLGKKSIQDSPWIYPHLKLLSLTVVVEVFVLCRYSERSLTKLIPSWSIAGPWILSFFLFSLWLFSHFVIVGPERLDYCISDWNKLVANIKQTFSSKHSVVENEDSDINIQHKGTSRVSALVTLSPPKESKSSSSLENPIFVQRKKWWGNLWDIAVVIVSFPPFFSFFPLLSLILHYDYD